MLGFVRFTVKVFLVFRWLGFSVFRVVVFLGS